MALERVPADIRANGGVARMVSTALRVRGSMAGELTHTRAERPAHDQADCRGRDDPRHGQVPHRSLR